MLGENNYAFMSIFDFKDDESKQKFLDAVNSDIGIKKTRQYKGCISINIYNSRNSPNKIIMIQEWESKADKKSYLKMREEEGKLNLAFYESLVKSPLELDLLTPINTNSKL